jgi:hypothetical protein
MQRLKNTILYNYFIVSDNVTILNIFFILSDDDTNSIVQ